MGSANAQGSWPIASCNSIAAAAAADGRSNTENVASPSEWEAAGGTWWIESWWNVERGAEGLEEVGRRIRTGPPA